MTDTPRRPRRRFRIHINPRAVLRWTGSFLKRAYAFALMLVLLYAGYLAVAYLVDIVTQPVRTPKRLLEWQARTDVASLRDPGSLGVAVDAERAPMAHFHRVKAWFQLDNNNGCIVSGCHEPLPHGMKMKVPAFANFHVSFLACQSCHTDIKDRPVKAVWMDIHTARPQQAPAVLQLLKLISQNGETLEKSPASLQPQILSLVKEMLGTRAEDRTLEDISILLETTEPGSPVWRSAIEHLARNLPGYGRGEYGAKLIPEAQAKDYLQKNQQMKEMAERYLKAPANSPERKQLDDQLHAGILKHPHGCTACHVESPGMIDFEAVGYLPFRAANLKHLELARLMQEIREGKVFHLPQLMEGSDGK